MITPCPSLARRASVRFGLSAVLRWRTIGTGNNSEACRERPVVLRSRWRGPGSPLAARAEGARRNRRREERHAGLERRDGGLDGGEFVWLDEWSSRGEAAPCAAEAGTCVIARKKGSLASSASRSFDFASSAANQQARPGVPANQDLCRRRHRPGCRARDRLAGACDANAGEGEASRGRCDSRAQGCAGAKDTNTRVSQICSRCCITSAACAFTRGGRTGSFITPGSGFATSCGAS